MHRTGNARAREHNIAFLGLETHRTGNKRARERNIAFPGPGTHRTGNTRAREGMDWEGVGG